MFWILLENGYRPVLRVVNLTKSSAGNGGNRKAHGIVCPLDVFSCLSLPSGCRISIQQSPGASPHSLFKTTRTHTHMHREQRAAMMDESRVTLIRERPLCLHYRGTHTLPNILQETELWHFTEGGWYQSAPSASVQESVISDVFQVLRVKRKKKGTSILIISDLNKPIRIHDYYLVHLCLPIAPKRVCVCVCVCVCCVCSCARISAHGRVSVPYSVLPHP